MRNRINFVLMLSPIFFFGCIFSDFNSSPVFAQDANDAAKKFSDPLFEKRFKELEEKFERWKKMKENGKDKREIRQEFREMLEKLDKDTKLFTQDARAYLFGMMIREARMYYAPALWNDLYKRYRLNDEAPFKGYKIEIWNFLDDMYKLGQESQKKDKKVECGPGLRKLENIMSSGGHSIKLIGNGVSTSQCFLGVTNLKTGNMMLTSLDTVCASTMHDLPPLPEEDAAGAGLSYKIGKANPRHVSIIKAAHQLEAQGKYSDIGLKNAEGQIRQLAIWQHQGKKSGEASNFVTADSVKKKIVGNTELTTQESTAVDAKVKDLLACVDLTLKTADTISGDEPKDTDAADGAGKPDAAEHPPDISDLISDPSYVAVGAYEGYIETCVPPYTSFIPNKPKHQTMDTVNEQVARVPVGQNPPAGKTAPKESKLPDGTKSIVYFGSDDKPDREVFIDADGKIRAITIYSSQGKKRKITFARKMDNL